MSDAPPPVAEGPVSEGSVAERRRFVRVALREPVKWQDGRGGRYRGGCSCDVSAGGMLVHVAAPAALRPGQSLRITVPRRGPAPIIRDAALRAARVVRVSAAADGQRVAVAFTRPISAA
jgi:hypothetical protein